MNEIRLVCTSIWYYSARDEDMFFEWIKNIKAIIRYDGVGSDLYLYVNKADLTDDDLRELLALFYRYKIDVKQLAQFLSTSDTEWFYGKPKGYWYKKVFGE